LEQPGTAGDKLVAERESADSGAYSIPCVITSRLTHLVTHAELLDRELPRFSSLPTASLPCPLLIKVRKDGALSPTGRLGRFSDEPGPAAILDANQ